MLFRLIVTTSLAVFLLTGTSYYRAKDDSMRCGSDLVSLKDTMYEVEQSCGEPYSDRIIGEKTSYRVFKNKRRGVESVVYLTEWIYERRDGIYVLTFEGSRLVSKEFIFQ